MAQQANLRNLTVFIANYDTPQHNIPRERLPPETVATVMRVRQHLRGCALCQGDLCTEPTVLD